MICDECKEKGKKEDYFSKAKWVHFDDRIHNQIRLLCDEHYKELCYIFGEIEIDSDVIYLDIEDPTFLLQLIDKINKKFNWYEDMMQVLHKEIKTLREKAEATKS